MATSDPHPAEETISVAVPGGQVNKDATIRWDGEDYELRVDRGFLEPPSGMTLTENGGGYIDRGARTNVANYQPRILWCRRETGPFTLLDAHMGVGDRPFEQTYTGNRSVHGAHLVSEDVSCTGVRFDPGLSNQAYWSSSDPAEWEAGTLGPWADHHRYFSGLSVRPNTPAPLGALINAYVSPVLALVGLWTGRTQTSPRRIEIEIPDAGWCQYGQPNTEGRRQTSDLLDLSAFTIQLIADWIKLSPGLGPIPHMAIHQTGIFQLDALVVALGLEGFHRRLGLKPPVSLALDPQELKRARHAAVTAAADSLAESCHERDEVKKAFRDALSRVNQSTYKDRVMQLVESVTEVAPGLTGPDPESWACAMRDIRNIESHQLSDEFTEQDAGRYFVLSTSGRWVLRICLLRRVLDDHSVLTEALVRSSEFSHALENIDSENYWPGFSSADTFRQATRPKQQVGE